MIQRVFVGMLLLLFGVSGLSSVGSVMGDDQTLTPSESPSLTPSLTMTPTLTPTPTQTSTPSPTWTPVIINVPVTVAVTQIVPILITQLVQPTAVPYVAPPLVIPALPTALIVLPTKAATPRDPYASQLYGWRRHESIEFVQVLGQWVLRNTQNASDGAYHNTEDSGAILRFPFRSMDSKWTKKHVKQDLNVEIYFKAVERTQCQPLYFAEHLSLLKKRLR